MKKISNFFKKSLVIRVRLWYIAINKNSRALLRQLSCESVTLWPVGFLYALFLSPLSKANRARACLDDFRLHHPETSGTTFFPHHDIVMSWIKKEGNKPCLRAKKWEWYNSQQSQPST